MIEPRQSVPIEMSSPDSLFRPLWQATQVSAVVKEMPACAATAGRWS